MKVNLFTDYSLDKKFPIDLKITNKIFISENTFQKKWKPSGSYFIHISFLVMYYLKS